MNLLPVAIGLIAVIASLSYVVAEPYFQYFPAKLYQVVISRTASGLGGDVNVTRKIANIGTASVTILDKGRLESAPPIHSYLIMTAGGETTYAVVFWKSADNGTQYVSFNKLAVLVPSLEDPVSFTYSNEASNDVQLGTF